MLANNRNAVPLVLQTLPKISAVVFVWSDGAFHWTCTHAMARLPGLNRKGHDFHAELQRSLTNKWAIFWPTPALTSTVPNAQYALASRVLGGDANAFNLGAWVVINMTAFCGASLLDWGGEPFDFFYYTYMYLLEKGAPACVALNTPETVLKQLRDYDGRQTHLISWLSCDNVEKDQPDFARQYFVNSVDESEWWRTLVQHTVVDLHVLPSGFDPDTQKNPVLYWDE